MNKNYSRKIIKLLFFCVFFLDCSAFAKEYLIGGKSGWSDIFDEKGITEGKGRFGYTSLELKTNENSIDEFTDLYLDFEGSSIQEKTGNYKITKNDLFLEKNARYGKKAALSRNLGEGLHLKGNEKSIFGRKGPVGSFSIEFWICPSVVENGEILFNWRSSRNLENNVIYQMIRVNIYKNKIYCLFSNIFYGYTENNGDVELIGSSDLIPGKWSHHILSYDEENGLLEYRIDGKLEDLKCITSDKTENGTVFIPVLGVPSEIEFCPNFTGFVDECKISKVSYYYYFDKFADNASRIQRPLFDSQGGYFLTKPIEFKPGTILNSVKAEVKIPSQTEINFFVRSGENCHGWTNDFPEWRQISNGENLTGISGTYIQLAVSLLPDGAGSVTPNITDLVLDYSELSSPMPPFNVKAQKGNGSVKLEWSSSLDETAGGYYIYYGSKPGEYLGRIAVEGASPIDVGNTTFFTLNGLKNGTIYYFALATYSKYDSRITGELSKEVFARPSVK